MTPNAFHAVFCALEYIEGSDGFEAKMQKASCSVSLEEAPIIFLVPLEAQTLMNHPVKLFRFFLLDPKQRTNTTISTCAPEKMC